MNKKNLVFTLLLAAGMTAPAAQAGDGYVHVSGELLNTDYGKSLTATWSVGKNPAPGQEQSWVAIEAVDSSNFMMVSAVDGISGKQFHCQLLAYNSHFIKVRRTLQLFTEGATLHMTANHLGECTSAMVVVNPGS